MSSPVETRAANALHPACRPLRVLFVESGTEMGGAQIALLSVLERFNRSCVEPFFVSLGFGDGDLPQRVERMGVPAFQLEKGRYRQWRKTAQKCAELVKLVRRHRIDLVFSNGGHPNLIARPAARLAQVPSAWWVHGYDANDVLKGHPIALAQMWVGADIVLANSGWTARQLARHFPDRCIPVVPPGTDCQRFRPAPAEGTACRRGLGIATAEHVVGIFGRLQPWKGQHIFLEAAALLRRRSARCHFLVVGGSPFGLSRPYAAELEQLAAAKGIADCVHFLGQRDDVNALMNACDVAVHASTEPEPWGQVVAEAMAAGRAVVASAAGGPLEMIHHDKNGLLLPPGDPAALATALESLLGDADRRERLGRAARLHAEENLDVRQTAQRMCEAFQLTRIK